MMAGQASSQRERFEDVFQDEIIIAFADIISFKKFARSKDGLCLNQSYIKTIVEDVRSVEEQKLEILFKWQEIEGKKATVPKIRDILQKYFRRENPSADESIATTSKAITQLSITEKVTAIIMFDESDEHLYSYKPSTKEWCRMQEFPEYDSDESNTTLVSGKHIYFIQGQKFYQLEYSDPAAYWKEMSSMRRDHGKDPRAAVLNGFIYVCGSEVDESRSVERYDAALDRWDHMCDMNIARCYPCVVATEDYIYCIGGRDERYELLQSVERFDERLNKWEIVESLLKPMIRTSAAVVKNRIYVAYWDYDGVLCYDVQNNSWSEINLTTKWPFMEYTSVKVLAVDDELYIIGDTGSYEDFVTKYKYAIYLLELETNQMTSIEEFEEKKINPRDCLAVNF